MRAITSANTNTPVGGCIAGRGADRIVLAANSTHTLTALNNSVLGPTGLPIIRSRITIDGNNSTIRRAPSAPNFRILAVQGGGGDLTLQETTVTGGRAMTVAGIAGSGYGGGI